MRRLLVSSAVLILAACATQSTLPQPTQAPPPSQTVDTRGHVIGLTAEELVQRFGVPALQIREGQSWKLQFRNNRCVLDAYLYPPAPGRTDYRVTYIETRTRSMGAIDQALCIASFGTP